MFQNNNGFNYKMAVLARESRGISQKELSESSGISQGKLSKMENGLFQLTDEDVDKISMALDYPKSFFEKDDKLLGIGLSEYFHRKRQAVSQKVLHKVYAKIEIRRMEIATLLKAVDMDKVNIGRIDPMEYDNDVEQIAQIIRASWNVPKGPIENVVDLVEEAGAIIIPFDFEKANIDGISLWPSDMPPLIFVNYDRPMDRVRFTICHELGHLVLHRTPPSDGADIEEQADRFASEFLMPKKDIITSLRNVSIQRFSALKLYWKTSIASLIKKASDLGTITERQTRYFWMQMGKLGYRTIEPPELCPPIEKPWLLDSIIETYQNDLKYSAKDMSEILSLNIFEFKNVYLNGFHGLRAVR